MMDWSFIRVAFTDYDVMKHIGIVIGIFIVFLIFRKLFTKYIFFFLLKASRQRKESLFQNVLYSFEGPVRWVFVIIGLHWALSYFPYFNDENDLYTHLIRTSVIILITWGLWNLSGSSSKLFRRINERTEHQIDEILIPFLSKVIRFIIVAISLTIIAQEFDYDVNGFIAGLGLGGLAIALAAQEFVKNLLGGVIIITEKPFSIGDWIMTNTVEGTVEDITFRSTMVRTFSDAVVVIPNSTLSNEAITNWSKMGKRRINYNLKVQPNTSKDQLEQAIKRIRDYVKNHDEIHPETIFVNFTNYDESGINIMLYFFTNTTVWGEFLAVQEEVNLKILEILDDLGIRAATPVHEVDMVLPEEIDEVEDEDDEKN